MGGAMARNLRADGWTVFGYDVDAVTAESAWKDGVEVVDSVAELALAVPDIITSLPSSKAVLAIAQAIAASSASRCVVLETSTLSLDDKQAFAAVLQGTSHVPLDCPLSGTGAQAKVKDLVVLASGESAEIARLAPLFLGFGRQHYDLGPFGNGTKMKLVANLLVAIHNVASAEALVLGMKAGLDPHQVVEVIRSGAGTSRMFEMRAPMMADKRYEPATMRCATWKKDMMVIGEFAADLGCPVPLFSATEAIYDTGLAMGHAALDTAAVCAVLESMAGLKR
jgi:3-hydroxyisobutyrate dehydrogenase-like beta-hydroxyacid dehydrogenase